jgi:hypothetical protein
MIEEGDNMEEVLASPFNKSVELGSFAATEELD